MAVKGMYTNYQKTPRFSGAFAGDTERVYFIYGKSRLNVLHENSNMD